MILTGSACHGFFSIQKLLMMQLLVTSEFGYLKFGMNKKENFLLL